MSNLRSTWDVYFLEIASTVATRATCPRKHVGAVLVKDRNILSTGYNGSIRGTPHCSDVGCMMEDDHCVATIHAEINAVAQAARNGTSIDGAECYVTASPCWNCFKVLANAGIKRIVYQEFYRDERIFKIARNLGISMVGPVSLEAAMEIASANRARVRNALYPSYEGSARQQQDDLDLRRDHITTNEFDPTDKFTIADRASIRDFVLAILKAPRLVVALYEEFEEDEEALLESGDPHFVGAVMLALSDAVTAAFDTADSTDTTWQILWAAVAWLRRKSREEESMPAQYAANELSEQLQLHGIAFFASKEVSHDDHSS